MQSNITKDPLALPDQALLFSLATILAPFRTVSDQRSRRGMRHPLATTLENGLHHRGDVSFREDNSR